VSQERASHKLGEVLRAAREERGVDLARVERDTKIRARYLSALESGDYRELPGAVYTKGFLRNYAAYLGLDAEYLIDLYRIETAGTPTERASVQPPPRPLTAKRARAFVLTPGAVVAAILTVLVAGFIVYFAIEFEKFARTPVLTITDPVGDVPAYRGTTYTIIGETEPDATIHVDGAVENAPATADDTGAFEIQVRLVPGSNVITLTASDPATGRDTEAVSRTIVVVGAEPSPTPRGGLQLSAPQAGAELMSPIEVRGTADVAEVTISATFAGAVDPSFDVISLSGQAIPLPETPPTGPEPITVTVGADGTFVATLDLLPAAWDLLVEPAGSTEGSVTRRVTVAAPSGLVGTLRVEGGVSYLEIDQDGAAIGGGIWGRNANPGTEVPLEATSVLRIRVGNAGAVTLAINGVDLGTMGGSGAVVEWRITRR
jgi:cytoskeletal protein RodZ